MQLLHGRPSLIYCIDYFSLFTLYFLIVGRASVQLFSQDRECKLLPLITTEYKINYFCIHIPKVPVGGGHFGAHAARLIRTGAPVEGPWASGVKGGGALGHHVQGRRVLHRRVRGVVRTGAVSSCSGTSDAALSSFLSSCVGSSCPASSCTHGGTHGLCVVVLGVIVRCIGVRGRHSQGRVRPRLD
jgi:hypothetical protein